ncbi:DUF2292 domain-containing protein [Tetragenococcus halophilus]
MEVIKIVSDKRPTQEINIPAFGSVHFVVQNGKVHRVEKTESTVIKNK